MGLALTQQNQSQKITPRENPSPPKTFIDTSDTAFFFFFSSLLFSRYCVDGGGQSESANILFSFFLEPNGVSGYVSWVAKYNSFFNP